MPCLNIDGVIVCYSHGYIFEGYYFELHRGEPMPLKKDGDPSMRTPAGFWDAMDVFLKLDEKEREQYLVD